MIKLDQDMLIGLMSRRIPYSITAGGKRLAIIRYWVDGPYETKASYWTLFQYQLLYLTIITYGVSIYAKLAQLQTKIYDRNL